MNKPLYVSSGLCLWFVREIEKIDVVGLGRNQSSLPPGFVTHIWPFSLHNSPVWDELHELERVVLHNLCNWGFWRFLEINMGSNGNNLKIHFLKN